MWQLISDYCGLGIIRLLVNYEKGNFQISQKEFFEYRFCLWSLVFSLIMNCLGIGFVHCRFEYKKMSLGYACIVRIESVGKQCVIQLNECFCGCQQQQSRNLLTGIIFPFLCITNDLTMVCLKPSVQLLHKSSFTMMTSSMFISLLYMSSFPVTAKLLHYLLNND